MDSFEVTAKNTDVLTVSELVAQMQSDLKQMDEFPLVWDGIAYKFDAVNGGYVEEEGYHLVKLTSLDLPESQYPKNLDSGQYEVHLENDVWNMEVQDYFEFDNGPVYTLALKVTGYVSYQHSFAEDMRKTVDGRWTEYDYE